jgi:cell division protein ZipA
MAELRWILLAAGLALIAGLYLWEVRSRSRSATPERGRPPAIEPPTPRTVAAGDMPRAEPRVSLGPEAAAMPEAAPAASTREPGLAPRRREPTLGNAPDADLPTGVEHARPAAPEGVGVDPVSETAIVAQAQRIIALRVVAPLPSRFEGSMLHEAVLAERFEFGRYDIFHRLDADGRPVLSLASLREPGTFDPATMAGAAYAGIALFAVLPGPLPAPQAFEELLDAARSFATRLGGHVQDDRGSPLTAQRAARLREEMQALGQGRAGPGRH